MIDAGFAVASLSDVLRLVAVPIFGWAAWRDVKTRRVPNDTWYPLAVLGIVLLAWDGYSAFTAGGVVWRAFAVRAGISVGLVIPLAYVFWRIGGFGGADAKALMVLAVLFPTFPSYLLAPALVDAGLPGTLPMVEPSAGVFSFTILTNAVVLGATYPVVMTLRNLLTGRIAPVMFVGKPVNVDRIPTTYGRILEDRDGPVNLLAHAGRRFLPGREAGRHEGLDLDALRMYLRYRGIDFAELRTNPEQYRDPASMPENPNPPGDGAVEPAHREAVTDGGTTANDSPPDDPTLGDTEGPSPDEADDPWGAEAFLDDLEYGAYGTTPEGLRTGLDVLTDDDREVVWVSPGLPFIVPLFVGLLAGLVYGDLLFGILRLLGLAP